VIEGKREKNCGEEKFKSENILTSNEKSLKMHVAKHPISSLGKRRWLARPQVSTSRSMFHENNGEIIVTFRQT
jgi:hypothetical protein